MTGSMGAFRAFGRAIGKAPLTRTLAAGLLLLPTVATAQEALSGFYAADADACLRASGTLYLCGEAECVSQDYSGGRLSQPTPGKIRVRQIDADSVDRNGYQMKAGDYAMLFEHGGNNGLRIVRQTETHLLTTYLARLDDSWKASFAFIENGKRVDPSAPATELERCVAYDPLVADQQAGLLTPPSLEARAPAPDLTGGMDYGHVEPEAIPVEFEVPRTGAHIVDVVPVRLGDPDYPALFVLWVLNVGGTPLPVQILTYDRDRNTYVDGTATVIKGAVPLVDYPLNLATAPFNASGDLGVFIGSSGYDAPPFPRTTNTLLLPTGDGRLEDRSELLPKAPQFTHDVSAGVIDHQGRWGIYANDMYIPEYYVSRLDGTLVDRAKNLPSSIHRDGPKFTSSAMADVNGDGLADLVLGSADQSRWASRIFLNDGKGRLNRKDPIALPKSPLADHTGAITGEIVGAVIADIQPIYLTSKDYADLVVISTGGGYRGSAVQILVNDGKGNFTDRTSELVDGPTAPYLNRNETPYSWMRNVTVLDIGGVSDIVLHSASPAIVPSYVLVNDGHGRFRVAAYTNHFAIASAAIIGGKPTLIEVKRDAIRLVEYPAVGGTH